jgi:serine/threonine protein phosphatase PrpC
VKYVSVSALSHHGRLRDHNEDSVVVGPWTTCASVTANPQTFVFAVGTPLLVAVADGLGGHPSGDLASSLVVQELARIGRFVGDERALDVAVDACNRLVHYEAGRELAHMGMGTTVAGLALVEDSALVFNVGDSRVYGLDDSGLTLLSVDDSPPLAPGQKHTVIVTQTIGGYATTALNTHISSHAVSADSRFLVCTDGLSDVVDEDVIASLAAEYRGGEAVGELWRAAMEAGGPDNITVAIVELAED